MRPFYVISILSILLPAVLHTSFGQSRSRSQLAILPFHSIGVDEITIQSVESLLRMEIYKLGIVDLTPEEQVAQALGEKECTEIPCAIEAGNKLSVAQTVLIKLITLGEKVIVEFTLVDVANQKILLLDQLTSASVEDLDMIMKRVAASIVHLDSVEKSAEVGLITEKETQTPRRRSSRNFVGFSFGYLYPQHGYDDSGRSFAMDFRTGAEIKNYAIGMQLAIRHGFAVNIFSSYLFSKKDFCPYLGGAFGFHWVSHISDYPAYYSYEYQQESKKKGDGFELTANSGLLAFHTYNIQIILNLAYTYTINDFDDQAIVFTIGLIR